MSGQPSGHVTEWDADAVAVWLLQNNLGSVESRLRENDITGDVLVHADAEMLQELQITSVGTRLAILKAIYRLKREFDIPLEEGDYIPETEIRGKEHDPITGEGYNASIKAALRDRDQKIHKLSRDIRRLHSELVRLREEVQPLMRMSKDLKHILDKERARMDPKRARSNTSDSKKQITLKMPPVSSSHRGAASRTTPTDSPTKSPASGNLDQAATDSQSNSVGVHGGELINDSFKSCRVGQDDPCSKVLPAALKKYQIKEDWQHYALFIASKDGKERCLGYNEKPLRIFDAMKEKGEEPVFVLKHIKQVKGVAGPSAAPDPTAGHLSPDGHEQSAFQSNGVPKTSNSQGSGNDSRWESQQGRNSFSETNGNVPQGPVSGEPGGGVPAVAIYEYPAQRDDELSVTIGDSVLIQGRSTGWFVVSKDGKSGWVPAGCLLEESAAAESQPYPDSAYPMEAMAIYDYRKIGPNELTVRKGERLYIRKNYQHWLLAECRGERGFVPSCYVTIEQLADQGNTLTPRSGTPPATPTSLGGGKH